MESNVIEYGNNWYAHVYSINGKQVYPKKVHVSYNGILFGDYLVGATEENGSYSDMGHRYDFATLQYHVLIESDFGEINGPSLQELIRKGYSIELVEEF